MTIDNDTIVLMAAAISSNITAVMMLIIAGQ